MGVFTMNQTLNDFVQQLTEEQKQSLRKYISDKETNQEEK